MIKRFINRLLGKPASGAGRTALGKRVEVAAAEHRIDLALVDERALNVVRTLKQAGHEAYIVGGAVRDLLVGLRPKDFDVATDATPEEVKALFRRAFIIGRRFRIVHVVYGRGREHEVIEVSTFRAHLDAAAAEQVQGNEKTSRRALEGVQHAVDASGRVLRDNVWGSQQEDAARRDFSLNAMYYDPERQVVVDYHKGLADVRGHTIRMIGDAAARYREDPVRIIRAVRFAAKLAPLGFALDRATAAPLVASLPLLAEVPQSRLFDEMLKLLQTGHALATIATLRQLGIADGIYPLLTLAVQRADDAFVHAALRDTDRRVGEGKPVAPSFLLACLLWQDVRDAWARKTAQRKPPFVGLQEAIDEVFDARIGDVSGRGKLAADMREIWMMQPRFEKRVGNGPYSLAAQLRFRAGFDFLRLRAGHGEVSEELADWWQTFSTANDAVREDLIAQAREQQRQQQRAPRPAGATPGAGARVHRVATAPDAVRIEPGSSARGQADVTRPRGAAADPLAPHEHATVDDPALHDDAEAGAPAPAAKKRRRRRKPDAAAAMGANDAVEVTKPDGAGDIATSMDDAAAPDDAPAAADDATQTAKKRRRPRRRKPAGGAMPGSGADSGSGSDSDPAGQ